MAAGATGTAGRSRWMLFQPIIQDRTPTEKCLCVYMCSSNPHLPRQFHDHHGDRYNNQWQPAMQVRAGISLSSQAITAKMLRNLEGHAEPCKNRYLRICVLQQTYIYSAVVVISFLVSICLTGNKQRAGNVNACLGCSRLRYTQSNGREGPCGFQQKFNFDD